MCLYLTEKCDFDGEFLSNSSDKWQGRVLSKKLVPLFDGKTPILTESFCQINSGLRGLYAGWAATALRCSFGNAAFFGAYALTRQFDVNAGLGGALAGAAFWVAAMPFDVIKSRMQTAQRPLAVAATFRQAVRQGNGGLRVLYSGLPVTLMRAVPMNAAVLFTFEAIMAVDWD